MTAAPSRNEVLLGDQILPIVGPVRLTNITVTLNPVVFGDTTRATDTQAMSQFIQSDSLGGSGIEHGNVRTDFNRHWKSRADTRFRVISLPPKATDMGAPVGGLDAALVMEFGAYVYVAFAQYVFRWNHTTGTWSGLVRTLPAVPTDWVLHKNRLVIASGTHVDIFDGGAWSSTTVDATYLAQFDDKLWVLGLTGASWTIRASSDGGATFAAAAGIFTHPAIPRGLLVFRDAAGTQRLYVSTDRGLYIYDQTNTLFIQTDVRWPRTSSAGKHPHVFRDAKLYVPTGGVSAVAIEVGSTTTVTPMGLDRDDGVPPEDYGDLVGLTGDYNWLWGLIDASVASGPVDDTWSGLDFPLAAGSWSEAFGTHTLRAWNGGWHCLWESPDHAYPATCLGTFVTDDGTLRVVWGANRRTYMIEVPFGVYNSRQNPNWPFAAGRISHTTPWWEFGSEAQDKLVSHVVLNVMHASAAETVDVYCARDLSESWEYLGQITEPGLNILKVNGGRGASAKLWRFRFDLQRGVDDKKSPIIAFYDIEHMRLLPATFAYVFELDTSKAEYRGLSAAAMVDYLTGLSAPKLTPDLIPFSYLGEFSGSVRTHYVRVSRVQGTEWTSSDDERQGSYLVSVIAPYNDDSF